MSSFEEVHVDSKDFKIGVAKAGFAIDEALKRHIDDMSREVESKAKEFAPHGPTGRLKADGIIRTPVLEGKVTTASSFGGGFSVSGKLPSGRTGFVGATKGNSPGEHVYISSIELNPLVKHAKWVHEGTGLFGPYHTPIVPKKPGGFLVFYWHGRKWVKRSVKGQKPQPFLTESFEYVRNVYEPAKLAQLRAEIDAVT